MHDEERRCEREGEPEQLPRELVRLVGRCHNDPGDRRLEERQDRERRRPQDRERQHDEDLLGEHPTADGRRGNGHGGRTRLRLGLHRSHCTHR